MKLGNISEVIVVFFLSADKVAEMLSWHLCSCTYDRLLQQNHPTDIANAGYFIAKYPYHIVAVDICWSRVCLILYSC